MPGTLLAGRYRIVRLIGRGGMGEVYQADDLRLDQPVALKFLPAALALNADALSRFHAEARIARQVSHPNVCRVHDIGDVDGLHFLTMELIDGEDLASLLRRIGRLPADKAVEIARQLCAGLAAAHDAGVLHRDLKPANVMIDGRGRARITDFGIAAFAREARGPDVVSGTPAYMAPEQLLGREATTRSDLFALGLVLYELFTGKRAFEARNVAEALLVHAGDSTPASPTTWLPDLDPLVERAILSTLEKDPARRPSSPMQVAAALPGGDPLRAALAAGETPSPEMVAAAGTSGALRPAIVMSLVVAIVVGLLASTWIGDRSFMVGRLSLPLSPEVLAHKAREHLLRLGHPEAPADSAYGFNYNSGYTAYLRRSASSHQRWEHLQRGRPAPVVFWYRDSLEPLEAVAGSQPFGPPGIGPVRADNPPPFVRGMRHVLLDPQGRLVLLHVVPRADLPSAKGTAEMNWTAAFSAAELDQARFTPADPQWFPAIPFDAVAGWTGSYREQPELPIRIEAAAFRGRLISFQTFGPWSVLESASATGIEPPRTPDAVPLLFVSLGLCAAVLAWRNTRAGRGDRRGAFRLAAFWVAIEILDWMVRIDHVSSVFGEWRLFRVGAAIAVLNGVTMYVLYLALEPYVRRHWPQVLIAWSRVLAGRWRDPLVGREVLAGMALGVIAFLVGAIALWVESDAAESKNLDAVLSVRRMAGQFTMQIEGAIGSALFLCFALMLLRTTLRSTWLAGGVMALVPALIGMTLQGSSALVAIVPMALATLAVVAITRHGLVAAVAFLFVSVLMGLAPTTLDLSTWYAGVSLVTLAAIAATAIYAGVIAMGRLSHRVP